MKLKWYGTLFSLIVIVVAFCGAAGTQSHGQLYEQWVKDGKTYYAQKKFSPPGHPQLVSKDQLQTPITSCIAEVDATSSVDMACLVPGAGQPGVIQQYAEELFLKDGVDDNLGFNWKPCTPTPGQGALCPGANGSWVYGGVALLEEDGGLWWGVQNRVVPYTSCNGGGCPVRARMVVWISGKKQKP